MMVNSVNDIFKQAHQGSVAAIIQVLNDKLTDQGVRTRAIFANGVLQLLCEAATPDQLEQATLAERIRQTLEALAPRGIRRVNINSRIVREQQLLWLDEISHDPNHLLWSQEVILVRPNIFKRTLEDLQSVVADKPEPKMVSLQSMREQRQFNRGIWRGLGLGAVVVLGGLGVYQWLNGRSPAPLQAQNAAPMVPSQANRPTVVAPSANPAPTRPTAAVPAPAQPLTAPAKAEDPFGSAVRLAEKAAIASQAAQTPAQWQAVAEMWGKAATLMAAVPTSHPRYEIARDRTTVYDKNRASTAQKAK
jgi:hypothetical protein